MRVHQGADRLVHLGVVAGQLGCDSSSLLQVGERAVTVTVQKPGAGHVDVVVLGP